MTTDAPYGTWRSPITSADLLSGALGLAHPGCVDGCIYWVESRPHEGGRSVVVRQTADGVVEDCLPQPFSARSRVHEYGGLCHLVVGDVLYFSNFADQRIYRVGLGQPGAEPRAVTAADGSRWADFVHDPARQRLIAVGERDRSDGEPRNFIAAIALDATPGHAPVTELIGGHDFFASPRLDADGRRLLWLAWDHPDMPWDAATLWLAELDADGRPTAPVRMAGGPEESVFQPEFLPDGSIIAVSDRSGWWNLERFSGPERSALAPMAAEFGLPLWQFGMRTWTPFGPDRIACTWQTEQGDRLGLLDLARLELTTVDLPWTQLGGIVADGSALVFVGAAPDRFPELLRFDPISGDHAVLRRSSTLALTPADISLPRALRWPTGDGECAHGFHYPPTHASTTGPAGERPPLLVMSHGGPTAATSPVLNLKIQFWTSRGFAVLDVNYRGSTGFGRSYRDRLRGGWGLVDVEDCISGARHLVDLDCVDPRRLAIRGSSAGGFTTLAALTFHDVFRAGASLYGIGDLEALAQETHKFEARYLDRLIGPWPEAAAEYRARSPIHHVDRLNCPVIFLQGLEDRIVPPTQADAMVAALEAKGLPVAYLAFEGEQHGFRQAANIRRALEAELYFYGRVFGFVPADVIEPVPIRNLPGVEGT